MSFLGDCIINLDRTNAPSGSSWSLQVSSAPASSASIFVVAASTSSQQILSSNVNRKGLFLLNDASGSMYVRYGDTAFSATGTQGTYSIVVPGRLGNNDSGADRAARNWTMPYPIWIGQVSVRFDSSIAAGDHVHVTELA